jgi:hypothetical protein
MGNKTLGDLLGEQLERREVETMQGLGIKPQVIKLLRENGVGLDSLCRWYEEGWDYARGMNVLYCKVRLLRGFGPVKTQHVVEAIIRGGPRLRQIEWLAT